MANRSVTIRGVPDTVLARLRDRAARQHRSLNGEVLAILARATEEGADDAGTGLVREAAAVYGRAGPAADGSAAGPASSASLLDAVDRAALARVCRQHHIRWLAVFGSHARGDAGPGSDIDVVVDFEPGMTPGLGIIRVADALRPVLGGRWVDLITRRGLAPRLRDRILSEARVLHAA
ncbi:MAG: nucleotidyltransferase domain-containing protein [Chloroflexi bacterium]|nr:nucleotidyltransferase domain-containing protein [Chloroflexota bacterium]